MILTKEEAEAVVYGDSEDWECIEQKVVDTGRWDIEHEGIFKHLDKYYSTCWREGATEYQDVETFGSDEVTFIEVHQIEKLVKVWEPCG